jgi:tRNA(fMet)-specific endonuclease VapC
VKYLLDTNAVIAITRRDARLVERISVFAPVDFGISSVVAHELYYGIYKSDRIDKNLARFERLYFAVVEFDREDAQQAGKVRAALSTSGTPIGPYDVLIAGQAMSRDLILITRNVREFSRVPGLRFENWESDDA